MVTDDDKCIQLDKLIEKSRDNVVPFKNSEFIKVNKNGTETFDHLAFSQHIANKYKIITLDGNIHYFNGEFYEHLNEDTVRQLTYNELPSLKENQNREVFYKLLAMTPRLNKRKQEPHKIVVSNGVLDLENGKLMEYSHEHITTSKIDVFHDPNVKSEELEKFIRSMADDDPQIEKLIYQIISYCLYKENFIEKTIFFYSTGADNGKNGGNGKSTLLDLIRHFIGRNNTTSLKFQDLGHEFKPASLMGKMVNIDDDMDNVFVKDTGNYKSIATGNDINVNPKGKKDFSFKPYNKLIFAGNVIPPANDRSYGFYRRMVIVPMNRTFGEHGHKIDPKLSKKLEKTEVQTALLNKCIEHLPELLENNRFTQVDKVDALLKEYEYDNEPMQQFLDMEGDRPIPPVDGRARETAYQIYKDWAKNYGYEVMKINSFTKELKRLGYTVERVWSPNKGYAIDFYHKEAKIIYDIAAFDTDKKYVTNDNVITPNKNSKIYKKIYT